MKHKVVTLLLALLFVQSNTAFATNWILVTESNIFGTKLYEYIDADTVVKKDNVLLFWYEVKVVKPLGASQRIYKMEDSLTNQQYRVLEQYSYVNGKPEKQVTTPTKFSADNQIKGSIDMALKYAKEGSDIGPVPPPQ